MASHLIGVLGRKRSGKDTFAARLVEAHGFTRLGFADVMKDFSYALSPWINIQPDERYLINWPLARLADVVDAVGWEQAKEIREVRRTLQALGTEAGRNIFGQNFWVERTAAQAARIPGPVVVTDVRFGNEAAWVAESGGDTVRVLRPSLPASLDMHPSETALDDYAANWTVLNIGTIADLHRKADMVADVVLTD